MTAPEHGRESVQSPARGPSISQAFAAKRESAVLSEVALALTGR